VSQRHTSQSHTMNTRNPTQFLAGALLLLVLAASSCVCAGSFAGAMQEESVVVSMPLQGTFAENFLYWTEVQVGNPPRNYTVTVDTGSSDLLVLYLSVRG
jgi:Eukaryotic aspartyl protease